MFTFRNVRILFAAALLAAIFCLAGCSTAAQAVPQPAETSRSAEPRRKRRPRRPPPPPRRRLPRSRRPRPSSPPA